MPKRKPDDEEEVVDTTEIEEQEEDSEEEEDEDDEEEDSAADDPDADLLLIESYESLLLIGYSPAQLDELMPNLRKFWQEQITQQFKDNNVPATDQPLLNELWEEFLAPAYKQVMERLREEYGANHKKLSKFYDPMDAWLYHMTRLHIRAMFDWPEPENG